MIGQIKLTRIHVAPLLSPGYGSNKQKSHLFTMSKDPAARRLKTAELPNLLSVCDDILRVGIGGADRDRTDDLKLAKLPLSQLSYGPVPSLRMVGPGRLELPTSRLSGVRSNHLSYGPQVSAWTGTILTFRSSDISKHSRTA